MYWCFVIGLALDIGGAALVVGRLIIVPRTHLAMRGALFPSGGPTREAMEEVAFTWVGVGLIAVGFLLQLGGYVIASDRPWLLGVAALATAAALGGGWLLASGVAAWLHRRALADAEASRD
jgi:hypothetical protein